VGVKQSTSDLLTSNCDEFIFYDDLVRESGRQSSRREARPAPPANRRPAAPDANPQESSRREEAEARRTKGVEMALQTFEALYSERSDGGKIWASVLKEAIKRRKPDFSESYYGFRSFGGLLEEMQARGFLKMGRDEKSNAFVFRSGGSDAGAAPAAESAPAAPEVLPVTHRVNESEAREPRGRGRARGGRGGAQRHDFEAAVVAEPPQQAPLPYADEEDDDAAERFADAARETQASRSVNPATEPAPDADTYATEADAETGIDTEAAAPREPNPRRSNRGGRGGRGSAGRSNAAAGASAERTIEVAPPAPEPAPAPAPIAAEAPVAAPKAPRARKTAAAKTPAAEKKPAAKKAAARPARKAKADPEA
jgi:hypothetical protein